LNSWSPALLFVPPAVDSAHRLLKPRLRR